MKNASRRNFLKTTLLTPFAVEAFSNLYTSKSIAAQEYNFQPSYKFTTLAKLAQPQGKIISTSYNKLVVGSGIPITKVEELYSPIKSVRERKGIVSFVQITDLHVCDAQSPVRFEFAASIVGASAFRPQEFLGVYDVAALMEQINRIKIGPLSGKKLSCLVNTGDCTDNHEQVELDWLLTALAGGYITPNTGAKDSWDGVITFPESNFWQPESARIDAYKAVGYPYLPGIISAVLKPMFSKGSSIPWYQVFGNHDVSPLGTFPPGTVMMQVENYAGNLKPFLPLTVSLDFKRRSLDAVVHSAKKEQLNSLIQTANWVKVPADEHRVPFTKQQFIEKCYSGKFLGAGPLGHGFDNNSGESFYAFSINDRVIGIALDTTSANEVSNGAITLRQFAWLKQQLLKYSTHYYENNKKITKKGIDKYIIIFSHHTSRTMSKALGLLGSNNPETEVFSAELLDLLADFPNVIAWVNGHEHRNYIQPHKHVEPERSFWEITTCGHAEYPHHSRVIDVVDNQNGSISIFPILFETAAPYTAKIGDYSDLGMGSWYRELAFNDKHSNPFVRLGRAVDTNTELILKNPL